MTEYKEGDRVTLVAEFTATVEGAPFYGGNQVTLKLDHQGMDVTRSYQVDLFEFSAGGVGCHVDADGITLAAPTHWPPRVGDVWGAGGKEWYAKSHTDPSYPDAVWMIPSERWGDHYYLGCLAPTSDSSEEVFRALNPVLKYRSEP